MLFKAPHAIVTLVRSTKIIKDLQRESNFDIRYDEPTMQTVIDLVMLRKLNNKQIKQEILEMHTINLKDLASV